jgi:lipopolysaccharide heptosyltransferase II
MLHQAEPGRGSGAVVEAPQTVVVLRFSAVGDVVLTAPALHALRRAWPRTRIVYAVKERLAPLVAHNPNVDEVLPLADGEGLLRFARRVRALRPGAVLDLQDKLRGKLLRALLPGVRKVVWRKRELRDTLSVKLLLRPFRASMLFADRYHAAVEELVGREIQRGELRYFLGPQDGEVAARALDAAGVDRGAPLLGLSPGAKWETKRWPVERYSELARRALREGFQVAVQGDAAEAPLGQRIAREAPGAVDLCGKLDLRGLGGFISRCSAFVANDSGPLHMARALGVPTLAFFGSTDPAMFDFTGHTALFAGVACSPCSFFGRTRCPRGHFRCMLELDEDRAWGALVPLLRSGPRPALRA